LPKAAASRRLRSAHLGEILKSVEWKSRGGVRHPTRSRKEREFKGLFYITAVRRGEMVRGRGIWRIRKKWAGKKRSCRIIRFLSRKL